MKSLCIVASLAVTLMIGGTLRADDQPAPKGDQPAPPPAAAPGPKIGKVMIKIPGVEWSDEQKAKIEEFQKEIAPKIMGAMKKMNDLLTDEQKKARMEAIKAAKAASKSMKEAMQDAEAAMKLTDEQKKQREEIEKDMKETQKDFIQKVMGLLTPEQKQKLMEKQMGGGAPPAEQPKEEKKEEKKPEKPAEKK